MIVLKAWSIICLRVSIVEYKINARPSAASFVCEIVFCEIVFCLILRQLGTPLFYFEFVTTLFLSFVILYRQLGTPHYRYTLSTRHPSTTVLLYRQLVTPSLFYSVYRQLGAPSLPPHSSILYIANLAPLHYSIPEFVATIYRQLRTPLSYPQCSTPLITLVTHTTSRHYHYCK